jgi:hypothetical protein
VMEEHTLALLPPVAELPPASAAPAVPAGSDAEDGPELPRVDPSWSRLEALAGALLHGGGCLTWSYP